MPWSICELSDVHDSYSLLRKMRELADLHTAAASWRSRAALPGAHGKTRGFLDLFPVCRQTFPTGNGIVKTQQSISMRLLGKLNDLLCRIFRHRWEKTDITLECGCLDCLWICARCDKSERTVLFRSRGCKVHGY